MTGKGLVDCQCPYPDANEFADAAHNVAAYLRGDSRVDKACAIHCGWVCQGFILSKLSGPCPMGSTSPDPDQTATDLENASRITTSGAAGLQAIDWAKLAAAVVAFLQVWLGA